MVLKVDLQLRGQENDLEKNVLLDPQKYLAKALKFKWQIQVKIQKHDLANIFPPTGFTKGLINVL